MSNHVGEFLELAGQIISNLKQEMGDLSRLARFGFQCGLTSRPLQKIANLLYWPKSVRFWENRVAYKKVYASGGWAFLGVLAG